MSVKRPPLLGVRHAAICVTDLGAVERFWIDVMGYAVEWRPDADNVYLCGGRDNLALHRRAGPGGNGTGSDSRLDHIGLAVPAPSDVDAWATHLESHGVKLEAEPRTHRDASRSLYFRDPAGTLVQIIHHAPLL